MSVLLTRPVSSLLHEHLLDVAASVVPGPTTADGEAVSGVAAADLGELLAVSAECVAAVLVEQAAAARVAPACYAAAVAGHAGTRAALDPVARLLLRAGAGLLCGTGVMPAPVAGTHAAHTTRCRPAGRSVVRVELSRPALEELRDLFTRVLPAARAERAAAGPVSLHSTRAVLVAAAVDALSRVVPHEVRVMRLQAARGSLRTAA